MTRRVVAIGLILLAALTLAGSFVFYHALLDHRAAQAGPVKEVVIPPGAGLKKTAQILAQEGVVDHPALFWLAAWLTGKRGGLKAGEYGLSPAMSLRAILEAIHAGRVLEHKVVIPEGFTLAQIIERLAGLKLLKPQEALALARDREFLDGLGIAADSLEGYLFPDTYYFVRGLAARRVLMVLARRFLAEWERLAPLAASQGLTRHQALTLASIIEREAKLDAERPLISAVYHNRLKKGMPLQADPTVIYGLPRFAGNLTKDHLGQETPYNTYLNKGLPPGPICSPGRASLKAALHPAAVDYLYFVAKGDGSHQFSRTYPDHSRAVRRFQLNRR